MTLKPFPLEFKEVGNKIVDTLSLGDTVKVLRWYYDKDFVAYRVKSKRSSGYIFGGDSVTFIGTKSSLDFK